jgi:hypothetical protein
MIVLDVGIHRLPGLSPCAFRNVIPLGCLSQSDGMLFSFASQNGLARPPMGRRPALHGALNTNESCGSPPAAANLFSLKDISLLMSSLCLRWSPKLGLKTAVNGIPCYA